jgi:hypothetical protein
MTDVLYREATKQDIRYIAGLRSQNKMHIESWQRRTSGYMQGTHHPQQALHRQIIICYLYQSKDHCFDSGSFSQNSTEEKELHQG